MSPNIYSKLVSLIPLTEKKLLTNVLVIVLVGNINTSLLQIGGEQRREKGDAL